MKTEIKYKTLSPIWDQTLIFESIELYGNALEIETYTPEITIELFDKDNSVIIFKYFFNLEISLGNSFYHYNKI